MNHPVNLFFLIILAFITVPLTAQESNEDHDQSQSPYFLVKSDNPETDQLPLLETTAEVKIAGVIADVTVHQVYKNEGKNALEAIYTFPASTRAAVYAMEMTIGKRKIIAQIQEREKARKEYEEAKQQGKRASLLEQDRPNVFKMNVANIMPGDSITVSMKYTELMIPEEGVYKFVYPTVTGPRYAGETKEADATDEFISSPYQHEGEAPFYNFDLNVTLSAGLPIQDIKSSTHKINIDYPNADKAQISLDDSEQKSGNRDFVLDYQLSGNSINTGLMLYEGKKENFFLTMIQPPKRIEKENIPPREYIFINDVSGSMRGYPMDISKKIMRNLVTNLRPEDRFNVMVFAGSSGWMTEESLPANAENINKAVNFIDNQRGGGGTNILSALKKALTFPRSDEALSRSFVIITDGYVSVEKEVFDLIRNNNNNANVFVFGIGSSVNRYLIEGIARCGMGEPFIVKDRGESNEKAEKFRAYISNPILTQIEKQFSGFDAYEVEPLTVPDVFAQRPILIYGKYRGEAKGHIKVKGYSGKKRWKETLDVSSFKPNKDNEALKYLWARKKIQLLDDYAQVRSQNEKEVTRLGLKYNLLTQYTSFIAVEEKIVNENGELKTVKQPLPLPVGVSDAAVGGVGAEMQLGLIRRKSEAEPTTSYRVEDMEVSEINEEISISFYSNIKIKSSFEHLAERTVSDYINNDLMPKLNQCLASSNPQDKMSITVGADGKIKDIQFDSSMVQAYNKLRACLKSQINQWDFSKFNINKEWEFDIIF